MQIGIDSFAAAFDDSSLAVSPPERLRNLVEQIEHADQAGLDSFGVGEHQRERHVVGLEQNKRPYRFRGLGKGRGDEPIGVFPTLQGRDLDEPDPVPEATSPARGKASPD